jgi:hypothetical protein
MCGISFNNFNGYRNSDGVKKSITNSKFTLSYFTFMKVTLFHEEVRSKGKV